MCLHMYRAVQKNSCMFEFIAILLPTNLGQPMHSQSALTELQPLNLTLFLLLHVSLHRITQNPILAQIQRLPRYISTREEGGPTHPPFPRPSTFSSFPPFFPLPDVGGRGCDFFQERFWKGGGKREEGNCGCSECRLEGELAKFG